MLLLKAAGPGALAVVAPKTHPPSFYGEHMHLEPTSKEKKLSYKGGILTKLKCADYQHSI